MGLIDAITSVAGLRCLDDCDEWCVGLPLESIRRLDSDEQKLLRDQVESQFSNQQYLSISASVLFATLYIASVLVPSPALFWTMAASAALMGLFVVWLLSDPASWLRRYKSLQSDLSAGVVHCFASSDCPSNLEVLPASEIVYQSNQKSLKKWHRVELFAVAKTPPIASIASDWLQPVDGSIGRFLSGKRNLSGAERDEIRRWAAQVLDHRKRHAVTYVCWAAFLGWLSRFGNPDVFYAALALTGYAGSRFCSEIRLFLALLNDAKSGKVVISRRATVKDGAFEPLGRPAEFLPTAQIKWTDDGAPAEWRRHR